MCRIKGTNVSQVYAEMLWLMKIFGDEEQTRNGKVLSIQQPVELTILLPKERVLFDPDRDANPFFHVMEFVWMMSGSKDLQWISKFNSGMGKYSDDQATLPASYGYRWRNHFGYDQLDRVVRHFRGNPASRRAVLGMWDPREDLSEDGVAGLDRPCNTSINLRVLEKEKRLEFNVINRSNDAIWGMLGANAVHMTMLHELLASELGLKVGAYRAYTTNLHVYERHMNLVESRNPAYDPYKQEMVEPYPLLHAGETMADFLADAERMVTDQPTVTKWFQEVATPIYLAYTDKLHRDMHIADIAATDWKMACSQWSARRKKNV